MEYTYSVVAREMTVARRNTVVQFKLGKLSTDGHRDVDTQVTGCVGKKSCNVGVKDEAVARCDGRCNSVMHTAWCCFPCQTTLHTIQLKSADNSSSSYFKTKLDINYCMPLPSKCCFQLIAFHCDLKPLNQISEAFVSVSLILSSFTYF